MDLQNFVAETLNQITQGVKEAKKKNEQGIAPPVATGDSLPKHYLRTLSHEAVFPVEFDVAVTVSESSSAGGGAGLTVLSVVSLEGGGKRSVENSSVSRVKFSVPVKY
jgi:hypothetical protein